MIAYKIFITSLQEDYKMFRGRMSKPIFSIKRRGLLALQNTINVAYTNVIVNILRHLMLYDNSE